jgi:hypothetical protein
MGNKVIPKRKNIKEKKDKFASLKRVLKNLPVSLKYKVLVRTLLDNSQGIPPSRMSILKKEGDTDLMNAFLSYVESETQNFSKKDMKEAHSIIEGFIIFYKSRESKPPARSFVMRSALKKNIDRGNIVNNKEYPISRLSELVSEAVSYGFQVSLKRDLYNKADDAYIFTFAPQRKQRKASS